MRGMSALASTLALAFFLAGCGAQAAAQVGQTSGGVGTSPRTEPSGSDSGPSHVANWMYACARANDACTQADNVGISPSWMAAHADWNEVYYRAADDGTSSQLAAAGAKHIVVYLDPNISPYCPVPAGYTASSNDFPENGVNCTGVVAQYLHAENGGYGHTYEHQANGDRLIDHADGFYGGEAQEPFYIGDPDLQAAFHAATEQDSYATDVFEDDGGGSYNCIVGDSGLCGGTYGPAHYAPPLCDYTGGYWCFKYGETAYEWDVAPSPQQAYLNDATALTNASALPVIGNDGVATDSYDLQWLEASRVEGAMAENTWTQLSDTAAWSARADAILTYHNDGKVVVEEDTDASRLMFQIASHWIVYNPAYSVEFLAEKNAAARVAGANDETFPEQSVVPADPLVATPPSSDVTVFEAAPGLFVREYGVCYENGQPIGYCAAVVNTTGASVPLTGLTRTYSRVLVHNTSATWAAGGAALWQAAPSAVPANGGLILGE